MQFSGSQNDNFAIMSSVNTCTCNLSDFFSILGTVSVPIQLGKKSVYLPIGKISNIYLKISENSINIMINATFFFSKSKQNDWYAIPCNNFYKYLIN